MKVITNEDCGNSPKNLFVQDITIAFAKGDLRFLLDNVTEDVRWNIIGIQRIQGKDQLATVVEQMKKENAIELSVHHVATHGKAGAVNGTTTLKNGKTRAFCNVYEFSNTKGEAVREITSYVIETK